MEKKYLEALEFDKVLNLIADCAKTTNGKEAVKLIEPLSTKKEIEEGINLTTEAKVILDNDGINSAPIFFASDPDKILTTSRLSVDDIFALTKTLTTSRRLKN